MSEPVPPVTPASSASSAPPAWSERYASSSEPAPAADAPGTQLSLFGIPGLIALIGVIVVGGWIGSDGIVLLASLIAAVGLVARGWAALALWGLDYTRHLSDRRAFPGDTVRLQVVLDNRKPLPLSWVQAEESLPAALVASASASDDLQGDPPADPWIGDADDKGRCTLKFSTSLGWYRSATLTRDLTCRRRGYYPIGPSRVASTDIFGLFLKTRTAAEAEFLTVYPRLYSMADLGLPAHQPLGAARDPLRLFDDPSRPMGLRPYTPETPFKAVAWKATARSGQLQAKLYEPTVTLNTALFLAVDGFSGPEDDDAFEIAISAVASLADRDLRDRRPVGVFANGLQADGAGPVVLPPGRAPDQRALILERLARLTRTPSDDFASFLQRHLTASAGRATLVAVGSRFSADTLLRLREQQRRGRPVMLLVAGDAPLPPGPLPCRRVGELLQAAA